MSDTDIKTMNLVNEDKMIEENKEQIRYLREGIADFEKEINMYKNWIVEYEGMIECDNDQIVYHKGQLTKHAERVRIIKSFNE